METPVESVSFSEDNLSIMVPLAPDDAPVENYYPTEQITDDQGNVLCEFMHRNTSIISWTYTQEDAEPTITVCTTQNAIRANRILDRIVNPIFIILYAVCIFVIIIYYRRQVKLI